MNNEVKLNPEHHDDYLQILFTEEAEIDLWREAKSRYIEK